MEDNSEGARGPGGQGARGGGAQVEDSDAVIRDIRDIALERGEVENIREHITTISRIIEGNLQMAPTSIEESNPFSNPSNIEGAFVTMLNALSVNAKRLDNMETEQKILNDRMEEKERDWQNKLDEMQKSLDRRVHHVAAIAENSWQATRQIEAKVSNLEKRVRIQSRVSKSIMWQTDVQRTATSWQIRGLDIINIPKTNNLTKAFLSSPDINNEEAIKWQLESGNHKISGHTGSSGEVKGTFIKITSRTIEARNEFRSLLISKFKKNHQEGRKTIAWIDQVTPNSLINVKKALETILYKIRGAVVNIKNTQILFEEDHLIKIKVFLKQQVRGKKIHWLIPSTCASMLSQAAELENDLAIICKVPNGLLEDDLKNADLSLLEYLSVMGDKSKLFSREEIRAAFDVRATTAYNIRQRRREEKAKEKDMVDSTQNKDKPRVAMPTAPNYSRIEKIYTLMGKGLSSVGLRKKQQESEGGSMRGFRSGPTGRGFNGAITDRSVDRGREQMTERGRGSQRFNSGGRGVRNGQEMANTNSVRGRSSQKSIRGAVAVHGARGGGAGGVQVETAGVSVLDKRERGSKGEGTEDLQSKRPRVELQELRIQEVEAEAEDQMEVIEEVASMSGGYVQDDEDTSDLNSRRDGIIIDSNTGHQVGQYNEEYYEQLSSNTDAIIKSILTYKK